MSAGSKRKRQRQPESEAIVVHKDLSAASDVWNACFGKDGNFTVVVEEPSCEACEDSAGRAATKRAEFKVWSSLLGKWSPVFEKMVDSDNYAESQKSEVVITDFSASAVEIFLRFMYSGSIGCSVTSMVEVTAIADKYQVEALRSSCLRLVRQALKPEVACEIFAAADRFCMENLRAEALDLIFTKPKEALTKRPNLRAELLEEILGSGLLCIEAEALRKTIQSWGGKDCETLTSIIDIRTRNEFTIDALGVLWCRYKRAGKKGVFVGCWVSIMLGREQGEACTAVDLEQIASNGSIQLTLRKGWVQWLLPHASVHLQGFFLVQKISDSTCFRIWCSKDGVTWHLGYEAHKKEIGPRSFLACRRPPGLVKWFKLEVLEGELANFKFCICGILQTPI